MRVVRALQERTGGFTEFVPLSFIPFQTLLGPHARDRGDLAARRTSSTPRSSGSRSGARSPNLQASWVKMGLDAATEALRWGVNDLGGTLMEESISRMAGSYHGVRLDPEDLVGAAHGAGRPAAERTTLYGDPPPLRARRRGLMAGLVLGPMTRWAGTDEATVWVETDAAVRGRGPRRRRAPARASGRSRSRATTTRSCASSGLPRGRRDAVQGGARRRRWSGRSRTASSRPAAAHPLGGAAPRGSCSAPAAPPTRTSRRSRSTGRDDGGREVDALRAVALRMAQVDAGRVAARVLLLGDQVYADEVSPDTLEFIRSRRDTSVPPGETIADFEEYTRLYREAWSEPAIRWLLSTVPSAMIFDDHDVIDDWNTSVDWVARDARHGLVGQPRRRRFMATSSTSTWGNLCPDALARTRSTSSVRDGARRRRAAARLAYKCDREVEGARWSYCRDIGTTRIVMIDSRAGRVLTPAPRSMVDARRVAVDHRARAGGFDHLLIGTSLPLIMAPALHYLEAWNEAVCDGAWGALGRVSGGEDPPGRSTSSTGRPSGTRSTHVRAVCARSAPAGAGRAGDDRRALRRRAPRLPRGGRLPAGSGVRRASGRPTARRSATRSARRSGAVIVAFLARRHGDRPLAGALAPACPPPPVRWRFQDGDPRFDNQVGTLELDGRRASSRSSGAVPPERREHGDPKLRARVERPPRLTPSSHALKTYSECACMMG